MAGQKRREVRDPPDPGMAASSGTPRPTRSVSPLALGLRWVSSVRHVD
jgi:hypothetical protein